METDEDDDDDDSYGGDDNAQCPKECVVEQ
jgi:hypothetical protein